MKRCSPISLSLGSIDSRCLPWRTNMPRIRWVEEEEATGELAEIYRAYMEQTGRPRVPGILKCFSPRPDFLRDVMQFSQHIHFSDGHLTRRTKEMIATYVSGLNRCPY